VPGLALFYGGLVRRKNVLSILASASAWPQSSQSCGGYVVQPEHARAMPSSVGGVTFLRQVGAAPNSDYAQWIPHSLFAIYQLMFAIITPALTVGAIAERMKFKAIMFFSIIWMFVVYFRSPTWSGAWRLDERPRQSSRGVKAIDFAGGLVVHMTSGGARCLVRCPG